MPSDRRPIPSSREVSIPISIWELSDLELTCSERMAPVCGGRHFCDAWEKFGRLPLRGLARERWSCSECILSQCWRARTLLPIWMLKGLLTVFPFRRDSLYKSSRSVPFRRDLCSQSSRRSVPLRRRVPSFSNSKYFESFRHTVASRDKMHLNVVLT